MLVASNPDQKTSNLSSQQGIAADKNKKKRNNKKKKKTKQPGVVDPPTINPTANQTAKGTPFKDQSIMMPIYMDDSMGAPIPVQNYMLSQGPDGPQADFTENIDELNQDSKKISKMKEHKPRFISEKPIFRKKFTKTTKNGLAQQTFIKTKICPFLLQGHCTRSADCNFAHSQSELRDQPNLKKTKVCQQFLLGKCQMGNNCSYAHGDHELRYTPEFYKTSLCQAFLKGKCNFGSNCRYAHGEEDLRTASIMETPFVNFFGSTTIEEEKEKLNDLKPEIPQNNIIVPMIDTNTISQSQKSVNEHHNKGKNQNKGKNNKNQQKNNMNILSGTCTPPIQIGGLNMYGPLGGLSKSGMMSPYINTSQMLGMMGMSHLTSGMNTPPVGATGMTMMNFKGLGAQLLKQEMTPAPRQEDNLKIIPQNNKLGNENKDTNNILQETTQNNIASQSEDTNKKDVAAPQKVTRAPMFKKTTKVSQFFDL